MGNTYFNNQQIKDIFLNNQRFKKMYLGINIIWDFLTNAFSSFKSRVLANAGTFENDNAINDLTAKLLQEASLVITPNAVKTSKLYAVKPDNGSGDLTVTRATTATRINASGIREVVPANTARIDYSSGKGMILVEPQRTNLVFPSATATTQTIAVTAQSYTLSFYGTGNIVLSGAFSGTLNGTGANNRVTLTFTPTAGNLTLTVNGSVIDWQLEAGSNATSLIRTTTTSVTRNADVINKTGISSLIGQTDGTIYIDFIRTTTDIGLFAISNAGTIPRLLIFPSGKNVSFFIQDLSANKTLLIPLSNFVFGRNKIIVSYTQTKMKAFVNGIKINETTSAPYSFNFNKINLSAAQNDGVANIINYNLISIFKTELADSQCIQLTTL